MTLLHYNGILSFDIAASMIYEKLRASIAKVQVTMDSHYLEAPAISSKAYPSSLYLSEMNIRMH